MSKKQAGFSMVELMIAISIAAILSTVLIAFTMGYVVDVFRSRSAAELAVESHFVLRTIVDDIRIADGIASTNDIVDNNVPINGWQTSDVNNQLIINSPAITTTSDIIYDSSTGYPYRNQYIYFITNHKLYRRTLKNTNASGNFAVTSCPETAVSSTCPQDKVYTSNINDISFVFYDIDNNITSNPILARSVKLGVVMSRKTFGKSITLNNSIQVTLRNY